MPRRLTHIVLNYDDFEIYVMIKDPWTTSHVDLHTLYDHFAADDIAGAIYQSVVDNDAVRAEGDIYEYRVSPASMALGGKCRLP